MLEVHSPHQAVHTWKDVLIHIAIIAVGLLLAIGLEQTVEWLHHRNQVRETRDALSAERQENIHRFHANILRHLNAEAYLHNNLRIFLYLRDHPGSPLNKLPGVIVWPIGSTEPLTASWSTAASTGVLERMPRSEVAADTSEYFVLDRAWQANLATIPLQRACVAYLTQTANPSTLTPAEIEQEIRDIRLRMASETYYGLMLFSVAQREPAYGPTPSLWQMDPFFYMPEEENLSVSNPALAQITQHDVDQAESVLSQPLSNPSHK
jgi:hypothetical protein